MKDNEYKCDMCGGVFEKGWPDEEAKAEAEQNFGKPVEQWNEEAAIICDDCYQKVEPTKHPAEVARAKETL